MDIYYTIQYEAFKYLLLINLLLKIKFEFEFYR